MSHWTPARPNVLVVACSDGRLQEATDVFLERSLHVTQYDRFYVPGGGGALAASGTDFIRALQLRRECAYLVELHGVDDVILLFPGPCAGGPAEAVCADYRRKQPWATPDALRTRQAQDVEELVERRAEWAGGAAIHVYRAEVDADGSIGFVEMAAAGA